MFTCKIEAGFRVFIFIILHFVLTNCIREDMSGCPRDDGGLALKFSYDTNADSRLALRKVLIDWLFSYSMKKDFLSLR